MTSDAKVEANRRNARRSTGPKTPAGKALARLNALRHGVLSRTPVVAGEDLDLWDRHRDGVRASLNAAGVLEVALADRAALVLWRLDRLARADAVATSADVTEALLAGPPGGAAALDAAISAARREASLADMRLRTPEIAAAGLADLPGLPDDHPVHSDTAEAVLHEACEALGGESNPALPDISGEAFLSQFDGLDPDAWTAGKVRRGLGALAACVGESADCLVAVAVGYVRDTIRERGGQRDTARERAAELEERRRVAADRWAAVAMVPSGTRADLILRYEGHLQKMLTTTLHELDRLQAARAGREVPAPVAVDVTVIGAEV